MCNKEPVPLTHVFFKRKTRLKSDKNILMENNNIQGWTKKRDDFKVYYEYVLSRVTSQVTESKNRCEVH